MSDLRLTVTPRRASLALVANGKVIDEDVWKFEPSRGPAEVAEILKALYDEAYDLMQEYAHGSD
jgi:hypothetical protein